MLKSIDFGLSLRVELRQIERMKSSIARQNKKALCRKIGVDLQSLIQSDDPDRTSCPSQFSLTVFILLNFRVNY